MTLDFGKIFHINDTGEAVPGLSFYEDLLWLNEPSSPTPGWKDVTVSGDNYINLINAKRNGLNYLKLYGGTEPSTTSETPSISNPVPLICNNGEIKFSAGSIYVEGTTETIEVTGKNLFDVSTVVAGKYVNASANSTSFGGEVVNNGWSCSDFIHVCPSTHYTTTVPYYVFASLAGMVFYDKDKNGISGVTTNTQGGAVYSFTTPSNCRYLRFSWRNDNGNNAQLELGTASTTYEEYYNGGTATAANLFKVNNYVDEQNIKTGTITRNVGVKVLTGQEEWNTSRMTNCYCLSEELGSGNIANRTLYCTHFKSTSTLPSASERQGYALIGNTTGKYIACFGATAQFSTIAEWNTFLAGQYAAGTPVIFVYPLTEPITETVTRQTLRIKQGNNVIQVIQASIDTLGLQAQYKAGAEVIIEEIQNTNLDNNVSVTIGG